MPGLYSMVASMRNGGFVVEGLTDGRRQPVSSTQRIIMLRDIAIYTQTEEVPLVEVLQRMNQEGQHPEALNKNTDGASLKAALRKVLPDFDEERVHTSDIRKIINWFHLLKDKVAFEIKEKENEELEPVTAPSPEPETATADEPKKTRKKKEGQGGGSDAPKKTRTTSKKTTSED